MTRVKLEGGEAPGVGDKGGEKSRVNMGAAAEEAMVARCACGCVGV